MSVYQNYNDEEFLIIIGNGDAKEENYPPYDCFDYKRYLFNRETGCFVESKVWKYLIEAILKIDNQLGVYTGDSQIVFLDNIYVYIYNIVVDRFLRVRV